MCEVGMMKHCDNCDKDFDTQETQRPLCGGGLRGADGDIAALMLLLGLLLLVVLLY